MAVLRPELPELTDRIAGLPIDHRGYPVPWFVAWLEDEGTEVNPGTGTPDFRVIGEGRVQEAHRFERCWVCTGKRGCESSLHLSSCPERRRA